MFFALKVNETVDRVILVESHDEDAACTDYTQKGVVAWTGVVDRDISEIVSITKEQFDKGEFPESVHK